MPIVNRCGFYINIRAMVKNNMLCNPLTSLFVHLSMFASFYNSYFVIMFIIIIRF